MDNTQTIFQGKWNMTVLHECQGTHGEFDFPMQAIPWSAPGEWARDDHPIVDYHIIIFTCESASLDGQLVFKNVTLAYEGHGNITRDPPAWTNAVYDDLTSPTLWYAWPPDFASAFGSAEWPLIPAHEFLLTRSSTEGTVIAIGNDAAMIELAIQEGPEYNSGAGSGPVHVHRTLLSYEPASWLSMTISPTIDRVGGPISIQASGDSPFLEIEAVARNGAIDTGSFFIDTTITIVRNGTGQI